MQVNRDVAKEALHTFREEQRKRTIGRPYYGCECDGCVESMMIAIDSILKKVKVEGKNETRP